MEAHCAVMVRIRGPDPKSRKMLRHAFHASESGETTLSASGLLLPIAGKSVVAVTCASIVEPYLSPSDLADQDSIKLVRGATLEVLLQAPPSSNEFGSTPLWLPAQILKLVLVKRASEAVKSLLDVQGGDELWEMGWSVANPQEFRPENATVSDFSRSKEGAVLKTTATLAAAFTRIAVLSVQANTTELVLSNVCTKGDFVRAIGSPFGALSPLHFFNSVSVGNVSNCWPSSSRLILMADIRALPGMEGGPVFDAAGNLVGILLRPLRQRSSGVEVQLILPAKVLVSELEELGFNVMYNIFDNEKLQSNKHIQMALSSIVLLTTSNGSWASGTLLNKSGLILTNAHLLEPWRFRRLTVDPLLRDDFIEVANVSNRGQYSPVQVRLERQQRRSWHFATVVFVSHGPLDVALLQLTSVPYELEPIPVDTTEPVPGSAVAVIGHGLFGPRTELGPSITIGVISRVVNSREIVSNPQDCESNTPVMLQTTAAVHPGGSGGVVVNSQGRMIGLVTSNAKHGGVTVIPYLNFSIPSAALRPVLQFAESDDFSLLSELDKKDTGLSAVWSMVDPLKTAPRPPFDPKNQGKGLRFAKFIADNDKHAGFESLPPQIKSML